MFRLHTSVNYAYGVYEILAKGEIKIEYYGEVTELGEGDDKVQKFNETLVSTMNEVTTYKVLGNTLILEGAKGKVEFEK